MHTAYSMASFYVGEERATAHLAPFLLAAPSGENRRAFLATQLVDEMCYSVFFDRFAQEVDWRCRVDDMRGRLEEMEKGCSGPGTSSSDDSRSAASPTASRRAPTASSCSSKASSSTT